MSLQCQESFCKSNINDHWSPNKCVSKEKGWRTEWITKMRHRDKVCEAKAVGKMPLLNVLDAGWPKTFNFFFFVRKQCLWSAIIRGVPVQSGRDTGPWARPSIPAGAWPPFGEEIQFLQHKGIIWAGDTKGFLLTRRDVWGWIWTS